MLKISVVTISFNQAEFLERCIKSVLNQDYDNLEYIIVDAGSTDGSREIINKYKSSFAHIILEPDEGPADGLNKGFSRATGDIYYYINSDDMLCDGAFSIVSDYFNKYPKTDVLYGNGYKIDKEDNIFKNIISNKTFSLKHYAYNTFTFVQQSTFFRSEAYAKVNGFNKSNRIAWDGELMVDFGLNNCQFHYVDMYLSKFRWYDESISGSGKFRIQFNNFKSYIFEKIMNRSWRFYDIIIRMGILFFKYILQPKKIKNKLF